MRSRTQPSFLSFFKSSLPDIEDNTHYCMYRQSFLNFPASAKAAETWMFRENEKLSEYCRQRFAFTLTFLTPVSMPKLGQMLGVKNVP